mgnify:CR=1 FL=1
MNKRRAHAQWQGDLKTGTGSIEFSSKKLKFDYNFKSRFEDGTGTNPEEMISSAIAACFSMFLSGLIEEEGFQPENIDTTASTIIEKVNDGFNITRIELETRVVAPSVSQTLLEQLANRAKENCPVSKALSAVDIKLKVIEKS